MCFEEHVTTDESHLQCAGYVVAMPFPADEQVYDHPRRSKKIK